VVLGDTRGGGGPSAPRVSSPVRCHQYAIAQSKVGTMQMPPLDPDVADTAPSGSVLTAYDEEHLVTYRACSTRTPRAPTGVTSHE
jgi:hypothetical protein